MTKAGKDAFLMDNEFAKKCDELMKDLPKPNTQKEVIVWHKYPGEKPSEGGICLTTLWSINYCFVAENHWNGKDFILEPDNVIAWAEMPKGWK
ncbi:MAG TPA: hypothetical protein VMW53_07345 [archaeon]|nr:hypothetical protein [archaeon]